IQGGLFPLPQHATRPRARGREHTEFQAKRWQLAAGVCGSRSALCRAVREVRRMKHKRACAPSLTLPRKAEEGTVFRTFRCAGSPSPTVPRAAGEGRAAYNLQPTAYSRLRRALGSGLWALARMVRAFAPSLALPRFAGEGIAQTRTVRATSLALPSAARTTSLPRSCSVRATSPSCSVRATPPSCNARATSPLPRAARATSLSLPRKAGEGQGGGRSLVLAALSVCVLVGCSSGAPTEE